jgi:hypothetical protein
VVQALLAHGSQQQAAEPTDPARPHDHQVGTLAHRQQRLRGQVGHEAAFDRGRRGLADGFPDGGRQRRVRIRRAVVGVEGAAVARVAGRDVPPGEQRGHPLLAELGFR